MMEIAKVEASERFIGRHDLIDRIEVDPGFGTSR